MTSFHNHDLIPTPPAMNWMWSTSSRFNGVFVGGKVKFPPTLIMICFPMMFSPQSHFEGGFSVLWIARVVIPSLRNERGVDTKLKPPGLTRWGTWFGSPSMAWDVGCMTFKSMSLTEGVAVRTLSIVVRKKPYMSVYLSETHCISEQITLCLNRAAVLSIWVFSFSFSLFDISRVDPWQKLRVPATKYSRSKQNKHWAVLG